MKRDDRERQRMQGSGFRKIKNTVREHFPFLIFLAAAAATALYYDFSGQRTFISGDGAAYYSFLPEIFISHKLGPFIKYPVGTAVFIAPFFLAAHAIALIITPLAADGYSAIYQYAVAFAALFYCIAGLILVYRILQLYCHRITAVVVCACIYFGTMLQVYATENASYSHAYAFAAVTFFIWLVMTGRDGIGEHTEIFPHIKAGGKGTDRTGEHTGYGYSLLLGVCLGFIFLLRNTDVIIVLVYLLFRFRREGYMQRLRRIFQPLRILVNAIGFALPVSLQLAYWKAQTGSFLTNSYSGETFQYARNPKVWEVLFSDAKGLFIFCPVLIFFLAGLFYMGRISPRKAPDGRVRGTRYSGRGVRGGQNSDNKEAKTLGGLSRYEMEGERPGRLSRYETEGERPGRLSRYEMRGENSRRDPGEIRLALILVFAITVYLYAAWWCWWLGAAYGQRTFCDILCIFAVGMGAFFEYVFFGCRHRIGSFFMKGTVCALALFFVMASQAFIMGAQNGVINDNLANWNQLRLSLKNFCTAEYNHAEHWWKIRDGVNRFEVSRSYFLSQFPQKEDSSYRSGGEGWLLFGPYKELPAGSYTVTFYLALEDEVQIPEDGILGSVGVNSNEGTFDSSLYVTEITEDNLTPVIENLVVQEDCSDFELQVYAACAGIRIDEIQINRG